MHAYYSHMNKDAEFRRNAAECKRMADTARSEDDRSSWLKMSESWLRMIRGPSRSAQETASDNFDDQREERGTGQDDSESSH